MKKIKIIIADDHVLIRQGLKKVIESNSFYEIVAETGDGFEVVEIVKQTEADLLILDINMPGKNGLDIIKDIKATDSKIKVLVLSMHPEDKFAMRCIKAGASGYINKEKAADVLLSAIDKVSHGGRYISEKLAEEIVFGFADDKNKNDLQLLSDREIEVLQKIASGIPQSKIAEELNLSTSTINTYRSRILEKLNIKTNAELIKFALENELTE